MTNIFRPTFSKIWKITSISQHTHCAKRVFSSPNAGKYGPVQTSYLDTFNVVTANLKQVKTFQVIQWGSRQVDYLLPQKNNYVYLSLYLIKDLEKFPLKMELFFLFSAFIFSKFLMENVYFKKYFVSDLTFIFLSNIASRKRDISWVTFEIRSWLNTLNLFNSFKKNVLL